jgi:hypothetical protein
MLSDRERKKKKAACWRNADSYLPMRNTTLPSVEKKRKKNKTQALLSQVDCVREVLLIGPPDMPFHILDLLQFTSQFHDGEANHARV